MTQSTKIEKRSVIVQGRRTSTSLEPEFWEELVAIAKIKGKTLSALVNKVYEDNRGQNSLASALRLYVLRELRHKIATLSPA